MKKRVGARGYGIDLRERIVEAIQNGESRDEVAKRFSVHYQTVNLYVFKESQGTLHKRHKPTGRPRTYTEEQENQLLQQVKTTPDATLKEHAEEFESATGLKISGATVSRIFRRHDITFKKRPYLPQSKTRPSDKSF